MIGNVCICSCVHACLHACVCVYPFRVLIFSQILCKRGLFAEISHIPSRHKHLPSVFLGRRTHIYNFRYPIRQTPIHSARPYDACLASLHVHTYSDVYLC